MIVDRTDGKLKEALEYAEKIANTSLKERLERLGNVDDNQGTTTEIYNDFAPLSFEFHRKDREGKVVTFGGIIYHGPHDGFGSGSAPTFSVSLEPTIGWSIHT